ncbi:Serine/threonine-protein kinase [Dirofilaria immitis]
MANTSNVKVINSALDISENNHPAIADPLLSSLTNNDLTITDDPPRSSENNHPSVGASNSSAIASSSTICSGTFGFKDFNHYEDLKNAIIDESFMPVELQGKMWKINRILGEGGNFKVYLTTNNDGLQFAMRICRKQDRSTEVYEKDEECQRKTIERMKRHLKTAMQLKELIGNHPNIVKLIGFRKINLCTQQFVEYLDGRDLYDFIEENYILKKRRMGNLKIRSLFTDLLKAVQHIHHLCIAHMDIKVENCILTRHGTLKLTDFDHAKHFKSGTIMSGSVYATEAYAAPETFNKEYRPDCADIWACGIFFHFLLKNNVPWEIADKTRDQVYHRWLLTEHKACFFHFPKSRENVSKFLLKMLKVDADERATVDEIIKHRWLQRPGRKRIILKK